MRRASWGIAQSVINQAEAVMRADKISVPKGQDRELLLFLYTKGVLASDDPDVRRARISALMDPARAGSAYQRYCEARERLRRIVPPEDTAGDVTMDHLPQNVQSFQAFLQRYPVWGGPNAYICPEVKNSLVQRVQHSSGLCYLHAPIVLQHYLVVRSGVKQTGMIDIAKYIRKHSTTQDLYGRIFTNKGGSSSLVLDNILQPRSRVSVWSISLLDKGQLEKYGPHLLAMFKVHSDFMYDDKLSFTGEPVGEPVGGPGMIIGTRTGYHAMVIVGVREKEDGSKMFLLQNWWTKKQFMEVDEAYIKACKGVPHYVKTEQTEIPTEFATTLTMYAETTLDLEETYPIEG